MSSFTNLSNDEVLNVNGGGVAGVLAGAMISFPIGLMVGAGAMIKSGDCNPNTLWKSTVSITLTGAAIGTFAPI